jgi:hypothetical protein
MWSGLLQYGMEHSYLRNQHPNANNPLDLKSCSSRTFAKGRDVSASHHGRNQAPRRRCDVLLTNIVDLTICNPFFLAPTAVMDCVPEPPILIYYRYVMHICKKFNLAKLPIL